MPGRISRTVLLAVVALVGPMVCHPAEAPTANAPLTTPTATLGREQPYEFLSADTLRPAAVIRLTSPPQTVQLQPVTLGDVIRLTVERNLDYRIAQINYEVAGDEVKAQRGIFDLVLSGAVEQREITAQGSIFTAVFGGTGGGLTGSRQAAAMQMPMEASVADIRRQQEPEQADDLQALLDELRAIEAAMSEGLVSDFRDVNRMRTKTASAQVTQFNPLGGTLGLGYSAGRTWMEPQFVNINPAYNQGVMAWIVQPLPFFRNWGPTVTLSGIRLAGKMEESRRWEKRQQLLNQIAAVSTGYWDLVYAICNAEVQRLSLRSAQNLLRISEIRLRNEVGTEIDVAQARAGVAMREYASLQAARAIGLAMDQLSMLTRVNQQKRDWKTWMLPRELPQYTPYAVEEERFIAEALDKRPDVQMAQLTRDRAEIRKKVAKNQRMPAVNAFGQYGMSGLGPSVSGSWDYMTTQDYDQWAFGLDFNYPIPNRKARWRYKQSERLVEGAGLVIEQVSDLAVFEVRRATRDLTTARDSLPANRTGVEAEKIKLDGEIKLLEAGMTTTQRVLEYEEDLAIAQSALINSLVTYNKAIIDLERARGTLLESFGITIEDSPNPQ